MRTDDFDYPLPDELIAQAPAEPRDSCRLLVLHREDGSVEHRHFTDILEYLEPGDLLVANRTRVMPARLVGRKRGTGGVCETLLLKRREDVDALGAVWECLVNPGKRLRQPGTVIEYRAGGLHAPESAPVVLTGEIVDFVEGSKGGRLVRFSPVGEKDDGSPRTLDEAIHAAGHVPLPPYITQYEGDPEKYQTVYAMSEEQVKDIDPSDIVSNTLLPADEHTIAEYGEAANNGVVVIVLRYDTPPRFEVGGEQTGYSRYVGRMVKWDAESDPVARVIIAFRVEADGSVTVRDVLEATDKRLCRRVLKAMEEAPRWQPALKDGEGVATDHVLRITLPEGRTLPREREIAI